MFSREALNKIRQISSDQSVVVEVINRLTLLSETPRFIEDVELILSELDCTEEMNEKIRITLRSKMSNYDHGMAGEEIAKGLIYSIKILQKYLKNEDVYETKKQLGNSLDRVNCEALSLAINSFDAAKEFSTAYDKMIENIKMMSQPQARNIEDKKSESYMSDILKNKETKTVRKRIRTKKTSNYQSLESLFGLTTT